MCVCFFFPFILDIKFVGRTSRGHTGERSHRIFHPPSFCGYKDLITTYSIITTGDYFEDKVFKKASSNSSWTEFNRHVPIKTLTSIGMYQSKLLISIGMHQRKIYIFTKFTKDAPQASRGKDHKLYSWGEEKATSWPLHAT